jgi:hypothetical protein
MPPSVHAVAVTSVTTSKTVVGQGYSLNINVTIVNQGDYAETFNITLYGNTTIISQTEVTLTNGTSTTITFTWNTTGFAKGNYVISAYAWPVSGETDTADNYLSDGVIYVSVPGDIDENHWVSMLDLYYIALNFGKTAPYTTPQIASCDIDSNGWINMLDLCVAAVRFGQIPKPAIGQFYAQLFFSFA